MITGQHGCNYEEAVTKPVEGFYQDPLIGLNSVRLVGGVDKVFCRGCGAPLGTSLWKVGQLHATIAQALFEKRTTWTWSEIRFVRKWLGVPLKKIAAALRLQVIDVERLENGKGNNTLTQVRVDAMLRLKATLDKRVTDLPVKYCDPLIIRYEGGEWVARGE